MRRVTMTWLLVAVATVAIAPALALANGPSAGDNQYTDPLKSTTTTHATPPPSTASTAPPVTTAPPPVTTAPPPATVAPTTTTTPSTSPATVSGDPGTLPRTGYDGWLAALLGAGFVAIGSGIRLRYTRR